jgi:hypothetical protein
MAGGSLDLHISNIAYTDHGWTAIKMAASAIAAATMKRTAKLTRPHIWLAYYV